MPVLVAKLMQDDSIFIMAICEDGDGKACEVEVSLLPGEKFGGRTYDEWRKVAIGPGCIDADWLDV